MARREAVDVGEIVRRLHWRAWDLDAVAPDVSLAEVVAALPVLIESGSAGIVWPRLRDRFGTDHPAGMALEAAARAQAAHNARAERELARVVGRLREAGVEPVLIKGLAVARLYSSPLVRPAGDLDLVVRDEDYARARAILLHPEADVRLSYHGDREAARYATMSTTSRTNVDLHAFSNWGQSPGEGFFERSARVMVDDVEVLVPSREDHLRALCKHFLVHGATRPLRLCDIALLFESRPVDLDWDRLLSGSAREVEQIIITLRIAHIILGMSLDETPVAHPGQELPAWLIPTVQRQLLQDSTRRTPLTQFYTMARKPWRIPAIARSNWPDPVSASVRIGAPLNATPRAPIQTAFILTRIGVFVTRVLRRDFSDHLPRFIQENRSVTRRHKS